MDLIGNYVWTIGRNELSKRQWDAFKIHLTKTINSSESKDEGKDVTKVLILQKVLPKSKKINCFFFYNILVFVLFLNP